MCRHFDWLCYEGRPQAESFQLLSPLTPGQQGHRARSRAGDSHSVKVIKDLVRYDIKRSFLSLPSSLSLSLSDLLHSRSEERRVGKECLRLCRSRWSPYH